MVKVDKDVSVMNACKDEGWGWRG